MKRRRQGRRTFSLLLWGTLVVVIVLGYLNRHPIRLSTDDGITTGAATGAAETSDYLVVLWPDEIARSADTERFNEVDWSWAWVDMLQREVGPVRICEPESLTRAELERSRVVVITYSAMSHPAISDALHYLEQFVNLGGTLLLERPDDFLRQSFSADGRGGQRTPRAITSVSRVDEPLQQMLQQMPLSTRYVGSTGPLAGAETLLGMDGAPVVYRVRRAGGIAVTVDFNFGLQLISLQQGRPTGSGFELEAERADAGPTVADLLADPLLLDTDVPYADVLSHFIVRVVLGEGELLPAFWPYPNGADGVVLLTHNVPAESEKAAWMAEFEAELGASSSFFFSYAAIPEAAEADVHRELSSGLAVLWERGGDEQLGNRRAIGIGGLRPFYRRVTLIEQRQRLIDHAGGGRPVRGVRSSGGLWSDTVHTAFQNIAAAGFEYDSSYGWWSDDAAHLPSFRHGTGRPFAIYDANGLPLGLHEVPVVAPELATLAQMERFGELLGASRSRTHQALTVQIASDLFRRSDGLLRFDNWRSLMERAARYDHPVMSIEQYLQFLNDRRSSALESRVVAEPTSDDEVTVELVVTVDARSSDLWLELPRSLGSRRFRRVTAADTGRQEDDPQQERETRQIDCFDREVLLVPLEEGRQRLEVEYR